MITGNKRLAIDVGGSHFALSVIDWQNSQYQTSKIDRWEINSLAESGELIGLIGQKIVEQFAKEPEINGIGIAFPGPFNYGKGISAITGVGGKFEKTFGLHIQQAIKDCIGLHNQKIKFANDAHCFASGAYRFYQLKSRRTIFLTLGTGLGSAYMKDGQLLGNHHDVPLEGALYNQVFQSGKAEDYFSSRWILNEYTKKTGKTAKSVKDLANEHLPDSVSVFEHYGANLGKFLYPWLLNYQCDELVIGGNLTKANKYFKTALEKEIKTITSISSVLYCGNTEECILIGAAQIVENTIMNQPDDELNMINRTSNQPLLPLTIDSANHETYHMFPAFHSDNRVQEGFDSLAEIILKQKTVIIDGYVGVFWDQFIGQLQKAMQAANKKVFWYDVSTCLKDPEQINTIITKSINGDDPVFGTKYTGNLDGFFDRDKLALLRPDPAVDICILYGTGASLSNWEGWLAYVDLPKNEIQYRMRSGSIMNLGVTVPLSNTQAYKRFYFVDWPILNKQKEQLLPKLNCIIDEQRIETITWMHGDEFRNTLNQMLGNAIRARPWFESGIWGGNWMKENLKGLNQTEKNYAWSFELITPENGIIIEGSNLLLEISFDFLLYMDHHKLLGLAAKRFGREFPIRFDFLDTFEGGNLSVQCHPRPDYIKSHFGESFTQDETYYILDCKADAKVYLGFQETINPEEFKTALLAAQNDGKELDVESFVCKHDAHKHDLFLIPNGTVHASGKNNMVLEISNTPYIFTFKMYDWLRVDTNGQSRPINIDHAFKNLYFDRKGTRVTEELISHPIVEAEWDTGRKLKLPTHRDHFYTIDRYEFTGKITIPTNGQCHCCMVVEGTCVEVITGNRKNGFFYAETFIIPASAEQYHVCNNDNQRAFLIVAYVKEEAC